MKDFFKKNKVCLISVLIAGISLCISLIRAEPFEIELVGVLATILSMLVTVLIGWNIYTVVNVKSIEDKIKENNSANEKEQFKALSLLYLEIAQTNLTIDSLKNNIAYKHNILKSILFAEKSNDFETCDKIEQFLKSTRIATRKLSEEELEKISQMKRKINKINLKKIGDFEFILGLLT